MKIKISATFFGVCSICGKETKVFTAGDEDTKETVNVCEDCAKRLGEMKTSDVIKEFGSKNEEAFEEGVEVKANNKK
jgi:DNA-directed RNA polymerase subunit RPC12/RpoP